MRRALSLLLVVGVLLPGVAHAVSDASAAARQGIEKYKEGEYEDALVSLRTAAAQPDELSELQRAQVYQYMAFCEIAHSRREEAKQHFRTALELNPLMNLEDPDISPKIREVFREVKLEIANEPDVSNPVRPTFTGNARSQRVSALDAGWRSALVPGWGQFATQRKSAGMVVAGSAVVAGGALVYTQLNASKARRFFDAAPAGQKQEQYDQLKQFNGYRNIALGAVAAVWTGAAVDAYLGRRRSTHQTMQVTPIITEETVGVGVTARF